MATQTTDVTRYLCASAHLKFGFSDVLIRQIFVRDLLCRPRSFGVDVRAVALHAIGARRRKRRRDALLLVLLALALIFLAAVPNAAALWFIVFGITAYVIVAREAWTSRSIATHMLGKYNADPYAYQVRLSEQQQRDIDLAVQANEAANLVVYSGYYPFVGSGVDTGGWSFAVNTRQGKQDLLKRGEPIAFTTEELYAFINGKLQALQIDGMQQRDVVFAEGREIRPLTELLPSPTARPNCVVSEQTVAAYSENGSGRARFYRCLEFDSWGGDLVVTLFYRLHRTGQSLVVETKYLVIPPLRESLRKVDKLAQLPSFMQIIEFLLQDAFRTPVLSIGSLYLLGIPSKALGDMIRFEREKGRAYWNPAYDYGAKTTLRQSVSSDRYLSHFQRMDQDMYVKIAERHLLDGLVEFLDSKNIDTSDIRERQTAIMNNGVIMSGGAITGQSVSLGQRAQAAIKTIKGQTAPSAPAVSSK